MKELNIAQTVLNTPDVLNDYDMLNEIDNIMKELNIAQTVLNDDKEEKNIEEE